MLTKAEKQAILEAMDRIESEYYAYSCIAVYYSSPYSSVYYLSDKLVKKYINFFTNNSWISVAEVSSGVSEFNKRKNNRLTMLALFLAADGEL